MVRLHAVIHGDVQGVGFRYFVIDAAAPLGLRGWVRNRTDGSVEVTAEGGREQLEALLEAARLGPRGAHVETVDIDWGSPKAIWDPSSSFTKLVRLWSRSRGSRSSTASERPSRA